MSTKYEVRVTRLSIMPKGEPVFSEQCTHVSIDDEAAGEFVAVEQQINKGQQRISINTEEWPELKQAIEQLLADCRNP
jgi:hypothetical protein